LPEQLRKRRLSAGTDIVIVNGQAAMQ